MPSSRKDRKHPGKCFIYSFIQQIFIECQICTRHSSGCWGLALMELIFKREGMTTQKWIRKYSLIRTLKKQWSGWYDRELWEYWGNCFRYRCQRREGIWTEIWVKRVKLTTIWGERIPCRGSCTCEESCRVRTSLECRRNSKKKQKGQCDWREGERVKGLVD